MALEVARRLINGIWQTVVADEASGNGGSSSPTTVTESVTTDASTFIGDHVFDLGDPGAIAKVTWRITAVDGDGETWGDQADQIQLAVNLKTSLIDGSYGNISNVTAIFGPLFAVNDEEQQTAISARYLKFHSEIDDGELNGLYAGANNPTATLEVTVLYL